MSVRVHREGGEIRIVQHGEYGAVGGVTVPSREEALRLAHDIIALNEPPVAARSLPMVERAD